eukprot:2640540-Pyramimonas_sp.AAC.1
MIDVPEIVFWKDSRLWGRCLSPGTAFWHDSGSSRRNSQVYPWRWDTENDVLACFRVFRQLPSNKA